MSRSKLIHVAEDSTDTKSEDPNCVMCGVEASNLNLSKSRIEGFELSMHTPPYTLYPSPFTRGWLNTASNLKLI